MSSKSLSIIEKKMLLVPSIGPKGVINDWRRFKLESMDQENLPAAKKEILRQMSSPSGPKDDSRANLNRKVQPKQHHTKQLHLQLNDLAIPQPI